MQIFPTIRQNISMYAHPLGCEAYVKNQIESVKLLPKITEKPLNILIIGGSSGYGLASRIAFAFNNKSYTYSISFERGPKGKTTGSAGFFNNYYFDAYAKEQNIHADQINADAFSHETKQRVIEDFKKQNKKIDLIIYSVASGVRFDPDTQEKYVSALRPIQKSYTGYNVDIGKDLLEEKTLEPATDEDIKNTIKVMGGEDYLLWIKALDAGKVLNQGAKTITYTYIGSPSTYPIYKDGTIGQAKRHLEKTAKEDIQAIMDKYEGQSLISSSKTVVTKASVFIPAVVLYAGTVFKVMKEHKLHESIIEHKYRLFKDMVYGDKAIIDKNGIIRLDHREMIPQIQTQVEAILKEITEDNFKEKTDYAFFKSEFLALNGFGFDSIDYNQDVNMEIYQ